MCNDTAHKDRYWMEANIVSTNGGRNGFGMFCMFCMERVE